MKPDIGNIIPHIFTNRYQWFISGFAVGILMAIGFMIRQPHGKDMSYIEGYYTPNVQYGPWFLANNHRLFSANGEIPRISNYTSGLSYGAIDFTQTYVTAAALILANKSDLNEIGNLYRSTPWLGLILLPLAAIAIYSTMTTYFKSGLSPWSVLILYGFASLPNYPMVVWSISAETIPPLGWVLLLGIFLFIIIRYLEPKNNFRWTLIILISIILIQTTYHTSSLTLALILISIIAAQVIFHKAYISNHLVLFTIIIFLTVLMYHAISLFNDYGRLISGFLADIYRSHDTERLKYSIQPLRVSIWWYLLNYAAVLLPIIYSGILLVRRSFHSEKDRDVIVYQWFWLLSLIPTAILLFAYDGLSGIYARILQFGTLLAISCASILLAIRPKILIPLAIASSICIFITVYLSYSLNIADSGLLTTDEQNAIDWVAKETGCRRTIFTDFRIGTTLGYWGCFSVIGPTYSALIAQNRTDMISSLLYNEDSKELELSLDTLKTTKGNTPDLLLISRQFMDPSVGFILPDSRLKPMTDGQWNIYRTLSGWNIVYENKTVLVMARNNASNSK